MRNRIYALSFGTRMWMTFMLLIAVSILATGWASHRIAADALQKNALKMSQDTVNKSAQVVDEKLRKIAVSIMSLMISDSYREVMGDHVLGDDSRYYMHLTNLQPVFSQLMFNEPILQSVLLASPIGDFYPTNSVRLSQYSFFESPIYDSIRKTGRAVWLEGHEDPFFSGKDRVLSLVIEGVPVRNLYILVNIKEKDLVSLLEQDLSDASGPIFMLDANGRPVMQSAGLGRLDPKLTYADLREAHLASDPEGANESGYFEYGARGSTYLVNYYRSKLVSDWTVYRVQSRDELLAQANAIQWTAITIMSVCGLVAFAIAHVSSRLLTRPLTKLGMLMSRVQTTDDLGTRYRSRYNDEVSRAGFAFNHMLDRIERLIREMRLAERQKRKAEMKALTAQIDPHFFYNALHTVYCKSVLGENEKVNEMIIALSSMFRLGLNNGEDATTLEAELAHVEQYLIIQQNCYEDLFQYRIEKDPDLPRNTPVLKLMLQPLVENSILHGFRDRGEGGELHIRVWSEDGMLRFEVADNGEGFDPDAAFTAAEPQQTPRGGYALRNIRERLALYYGGEASLDIRSAPGEGTTASVTIPIREEGDEDDGTT